MRIRGERVFVMRRRWTLVAAALVLSLLGWAVAVLAGSGGPTPGGRAAGAGSAVPPSRPADSPAPIRAPAPIPGFLLVADRGNRRLLLLDGSKRIVWRYPTAAGPRPARPLGSDDAFFAPGYRSIMTNQEAQQTIRAISFPGGAVTWTYGHRGSPGAARGYLNTPDDAYALPNGTVSVADIKNCRVLFIRPPRTIVRQIGTTGTCVHHPPRSFGSPNGDTPMPNGGTLVTEINGSWVDGISAAGRLLFSVHAPVAYPSDAQWLGGGRILLADFSSPGSVLIMTTRGRVLWRYGPTSGPGMLNHPSLALMLPNGLIAVNDDFNDRVVLIDPKRHRIVWQYGHTGVSGRAPGYLNDPDGMDFLPLSAVEADPALRSALAGG